MVRITRNALFLIFILCIASSCTFVRYFAWNYADINDDKKFPAVPVHKGQQTFSFFPHPGNITIHPVSDKHPLVFEDMLKENKTVSFLIVRNDTLIYENYFDGYDAKKAIPSFSVSKSFVSALTGIAIGEGKIRDTKQVVTDYLPWMTSPGFDKVRIEDLLNMRAGLDFTESYSSPFELMPKFYYGRHLLKYTGELKVNKAADSIYEYQSANTLLLSLIIEKAVGMPINQYLEEKLWIPMGMESDASWSVDNEKEKTVKSFCCLNAVSRDYARFGRLYLGQGNWDGKQLVPKDWVDRTMSVINDTREGQGYHYTYQWRVTPKGAIFAKGVLGQYIYVYPKKKIVIVRLGKDPGNLSWPMLFERLVDQL